MTRETIVRLYLPKDENFIGILETDKGIYGINWFGYKHLSTHIPVNKDALEEEWNIKGKQILICKNDTDNTLLKLEDNSFLKFGVGGMDVNDKTFSHITYYDKTEVENDTEFLNWFENEMIELTDKRSRTIP